MSQVNLLLASIVKYPLNLNKNQFFFNIAIYHMSNINIKKILKKLTSD